MSAHLLKFKNHTDLLKFIDEQEIRFVDLNFTDLRGELRHITQHASTINKDLLENGVYFDASSIPGWKSIEDSDMVLMPDLQRAALDPFAAQRTLKLFCMIHGTNTGRPYNRDPRQIAQAAEQYLKSSGLADAAYFGPEAEFFLFEDVRIDDAPHKTGFAVDSIEGPYNSGRAYPEGNAGHRPAPKSGYVVEGPVDALSDIRAEMMTVMDSMGVAVEKHHHEVAPAQCEIGILYSTLTHCADNVQIYKHVVHNVAHSYGKTATFMPKPIQGDNGSGMHCHQSLWKNGKPLFAGNGYADLSETALYYIGGIIKHARALNAFTNPTTNSYKRLVPGFEAPTLLAYGAKNRSAACRIPPGQSAAAKRVEVRFPDPAANPYLATAAMLMAGLDGIENKIHPGEALDKNLYELSAKAQKSIPTLCVSLDEALNALEKDHGFLTKGDVFSTDMIEAYIALKREEVETYNSAVHPAEYKMYYSV